MSKVASFKCAASDRAVITKICERYENTTGATEDPNYERINLDMDLTACHANGCPLDFEKLLLFPDFDFFHDLHGISRHIDRTTGELKDFFLPRCSK